MAKFLSQLSGFFFYTLGLSFFLCVVLVKNNVGGEAPIFWLQVADLPLMLSALLYAGSSLYLSIRTPGSHPRVLAAAIGVPLVAFFLVLMLFNFWPK